MIPVVLDKTFSTPDHTFAVIAPEFVNCAGMFLTNEGTFVRFVPFLLAE
jgi:hypothetical protein